MKLKITHCVNLSLDEQSSLEVDCGYETANKTLTDALQALAKKEAESNGYDVEDTTIAFLLEIDPTWLKDWVNYMDGGQDFWMDDMCHRLELIKG